MLLAMMAVGRSLPLWPLPEFLLLLHHNKTQAESRGRHRYRCLVAAVVLSPVPDVRHAHGPQNCCSFCSANDVVAARTLLLR